MNKEIKKLNDEIIAAKADSFNKGLELDSAFEALVRIPDRTITDEKIEIAVDIFRDAIEARRQVERLTERYRIENKEDWVAL